MSKDYFITCTLSESSHKRHPAPSTLLLHGIQNTRIGETKKAILSRAPLVLFASPYVRVERTTFYDCFSRFPPPWGTNIILFHSRHSLAKHPGGVDHSALPHTNARVVEKRAKSPDNWSTPNGQKEQEESIIEPYSLSLQTSITVDCHQR